MGATAINTAMLLGQQLDHGRRTPRRLRDARRWLRCESIPGVSLGDERSFPWLGVTVVLGLGFLVGQWMAWSELKARGIFRDTNPNSSFVYLLTAAHAVHLAGGTDCVALGGHHFPAAQANRGAADCGRRGGLVLAFHGGAVDLCFCSIGVRKVASQTRDFCVAKNATLRALAQVLRLAKYANLRMTNGKGKLGMADAALQHNAAAGHGAAGEYEAPLFGAYSKKVGMWLFLASDSLTFGALLFAFSYNRIYTIRVANAFGSGQHYQRHDDDGVPAFELVDHGAGGVRGAAARPNVDAELAAGDDGLRHSIHRAARHGVDAN